MQLEGNKQNEQGLIKQSNLSKNRIMKNRLILVTSINILSFFVMIFSMCFYQWIWITVEVVKYSEQPVQSSLWINLLYVKLEGQNFYSSFDTATDDFCQPGDLYCQSLFIEFSFLGYLCFSIFMFGASLQLYDFVRMIYYAWNSKQTTDRKDDFRHLVTIFAYLIAQTLSAFGIAEIAPINSVYGVSFWLNISTIAVFIGVIIYEQVSVRQLGKQQLILDLIEEEDKLRRKEIKLELSSESEFRI